MFFFFFVSFLSFCSPPSSFPFLYTFLHPNSFLFSPIHYSFKFPIKNTSFSYTFVQQCNYQLGPMELNSSGLKNKLLFYSILFYSLSLSLIFLRPSTYFSLSSSLPFLLNSLNDLLTSLFISSYFRSLLSVSYDILL